LFYFDKNDDEKNDDEKNDDATNNTKNYSHIVHKQQTWESHSNSGGGRIWMQTLRIL
jgi:hypothetical protein